MQFFVGIILGIIALILGAIASAIFGALSLLLQFTSFRALTFGTATSPTVFGQTIDTIFNAEYGLTGLALAAMMAYAFVRHILSQIGDNQPTTAPGKVISRAAIALFWITGSRLFLGAILSINNSLTGYYSGQATGNWFSVFDTGSFASSLTDTFKTASLGVAGYSTALVATTVGDTLVPILILVAAVLLIIVLGVYYFREFEIVLLFGLIPLIQTVSVMEEHSSSAQNIWKNLAASVFAQAVWALQWWILSLLIIGPSSTPSNAAKAVGADPLGSIFLLIAGLLFMLKTGHLLRELLGVRFGGGQAVGGSMLGSMLGYSAMRALAPATPIGQAVQGFTNGLVEKAATSSGFGGNLFRHAAAFNQRAQQGRQGAMEALKDVPNVGLGAALFGEGATPGSPKGWAAATRNAFTGNTPMAADRTVLGGGSPLAGSAGRTARQQEGVNALYTGAKTSTAAADAGEARPGLRYEQSLGDHNVAAQKGAADEQVAANNPALMRTLARQAANKDMRQAEGRARVYQENPSWATRTKEAKSKIRDAAEPATQTEPTPPTEGAPGSGISKPTSSTIQPTTRPTTRSRKPTTQTEPTPPPPGPIIRKRMGP